MTLKSEHNPKKVAAKINCGDFEIVIDKEIGKFSGIIKTVIESRKWKIFVGVKSPRIPRLSGYHFIHSVTLTFDGVIRNSRILWFSIAFPPQCTV